jgi:hypothetical protein
MADRQPKRFRTAAAVLLVLVSVISGQLAILAETARSTVLTRSFYDRALDDAHAYDRLYSQVLPDPAVASLTKDLLAQLPFDRTLITANLRVVLPTSALRGLVDEQLDRALAYLHGSPDLTLTVDLTPLFTNIAQLANLYIARDVASAPTYSANSVRQFTTQVLAALGEIASGNPPAKLPKIQLSTADAVSLTRTILSRLTPADRAKVHSQLLISLTENDLAGALAVVGPLIFPGAVLGSQRVSRLLEHGTQLNLKVKLAALHGRPSIRALEGIHRLGGHAGALVVVAIALALAFLVAAMTVARRLGRRRCLQLAAGSVFATAVTALLGGLAIRLTLTNPLQPLTGQRSPLPRAGRRLVSDIGDAAFAQVQGRYVQLAASVLVVGALCLIALVLSVRMRAFRARGRGRTIAALATLSPALLLLLVSIALPQDAAGQTLVCNGFAQLCDRPYNKVSFAASHNAMATSEDQFLGPAQDPSMVNQLDSGVRALLIDTHYWTPAGEAATFLGSLPPGLQSTLRTFAAAAASTRKGSWLCHNICQLGATPLVEQLRLIRGWLDRNPDEVITLIVQDGITPGDTEAAVRQSGLLPLVDTPPSDPQGDWPSLRHMIASGHRVVIFAEQADQPGTWYRNFYRYASDTPFRNQTRRA